jgi:hypothetical protein
MLVAMVANAMSILLALPLVLFLAFVLGKAQGER